MTPLFTKYSTGQLCFQGFLLQEFPPGQETVRIFVLKEQEERGVNEALPSKKVEQEMIILKQERWNSKRRTNNDTYSAKVWVVQEGAEHLDRVGSEQFRYMAEVYGEKLPW